MQKINNPMDRLNSNLFRPNEYRLLELLNPKLIQYLNTLSKGLRTKKTPNLETTMPQPIRSLSWEFYFL